MTSQCRYYRKHLTMVMNSIRSRGLVSFPGLNSWRGRGTGVGDCFETSFYQAPQIKSSVTDKNNKLGYSDKSEGESVLNLEEVHEIPIKFGKIVAMCDGK